jgi:hypothetical protein
VFNAEATPARLTLAGDVSATSMRLDEAPADGDEELRAHEIATFRLRPSNNARFRPHRL